MWQNHESILQYCTSFSSSSHISILFFSNHLYSKKNKPYFFLVFSGGRAVHLRWLCPDRPWRGDPRLLRPPWAGIARGKDAGGTMLHRGGTLHCEPHARLKGGQGTLNLQGHRLSLPEEEIVGTRLRQGSEEQENLHIWKCPEKNEEKWSQFLKFVKILWCGGHKIQEEKSFSHPWKGEEEDTLTGSVVFPPSFSCWYQEEKREEK